MIAWFWNCIYLIFAILVFIYCKVLLKYSEVNLLTEEIAALIYMMEYLKLYLNLWVMHDHLIVSFFSCFSSFYIYVDATYPLLLIGCLSTLTGSCNRDIRRRQGSIWNLIFIRSLVTKYSFSIRPVDRRVLVNLEHHFYWKKRLCHMCRRFVLKFL